MNGVSIAARPQGPQLTIRGAEDARSGPGMTGKRRAAKWLCVRGILKTNRRNRPICFQEVAEYQQDRCPANAAACGGLADGECRYRDAVFFGGTDLPFPRRGREMAAASGAKRRDGEAAKRGNGGETGKRRNGETGKGRGIKKQKGSTRLPFCGPCRA